LRRSGLTVYWRVTAAFLLTTHRSSRQIAGMHYTQGIARLLPRASGWLGRMHPASEADQGALLRFLDPDFSDAVEVYDQIHVPLFDFDENGHIELSAPMTVTMVDRVAGVIQVEPPLLTVCPGWNKWRDENRRLVIPDAHLPMGTVDMNEEMTVMLRSTRTAIKNLAERHWQAARQKVAE
jgi:hypothetical protein